jgi:ABC-type Fe3+-hydroxamate transport system substrate-binding protein
MRIASLQPSITLILKSLSRLDALCACTRYCIEAVPELADRNLPILHDSWTANTDEILAAAPDLVLASVPYASNRSRPSSNPAYRCSPSRRTPSRTSTPTLA